LGRAKQKLFDRPVVFADIETTGLGARSGKIIEIALIRVEQNKITQEFHSLVNPGHHLPEWISNLTGILDKDLEGQPLFDDIADKVAQVCEGAIFIAHNVRFDYSFIKNHLADCGQAFKPELLCTVRLSRALYPDERSHKLENIINRHGIKVPARHRAYEDAKALLDFCKIAFEQHGQEVFEAAVAKQVKQKSLPPNLHPDNLNRISNNPGVYIFEDEQGKPLYVGKSIHLRQRVMSHFSADTESNKEMRMSLNTHNIKTVETANELDALLLESKLVKELLPLYNRKLRRARKYVALLKKVNSDGYISISIDDIDLADCNPADLYGIYETRGKAKTALESHQQTFSICPKFLGLEKGRGPCFKYHLGKCSGACTGKESAEKHNLRLELALECSKVEAWPYDEPVCVEHIGQEGSGIIVDQWKLIGQIEQNRVIEDATINFFDLDNYRILRSYLSSKKNLLKFTTLSQYQLNTGF
jgi:DNA polymerase-3 subunit epsilon